MSGQFRTLVCLFVCLFIVCLKEFHRWITSDFSPPPPLSYDDDAYDYDDDDDFDDDYDYDDDYDDDLDDYYDYDDDNDDDNDDYDEVTIDGSPPTILRLPSSPHWHLEAKKILQKISQSKYRKTQQDIYTQTQSTLTSWG